MTVVQGTDARLVPTALVVWAACFLAVGLAPRAAVLLGLSLAVVGVAGAVVRRQGSTGGDDVVVTVLLALGVGALACGVTAVQAAVREAGALVHLADAGEAAVLEGRVMGDPVPVGRWEPRYRVRLRVSGVEGESVGGPAAADVLLTGGREWAAVQHGSTVRGSGRLTRAARADDVVALVRSAAPPQVLAPAAGGAVVVELLRDGLRQATAGLPPDRRGLVVGTAVGATQHLPEDLRQAMRDAGLTHVTAVSGAHFAVVAMTVLALAATLRGPPVVRAVVLVAAGLGFLHLVHGGTSVVRAAAAAAVWCLAIVLGRPARALPALAGGVTVLLLVDPWLARSYGFALSAGATAAIVLLAPALVARRPRTVPRAVATVLAVPLSAQAACAPVLVLLDPVVTTYAVPANVLAAPALLPATLLGLLSAVLSPVLPGVAGVVAGAAAVPAGWVGVVARTAAGLPAARLPWFPGLPGALALAVVVAALVLTVLRRCPRRV
ncbi:MAG: ComEC/Rec2 family competence protein [Actinotalea sp.]|nr:ComEC/Rec2 family competence protein [Actinotalea sp.]